MYLCSYTATSTYDATPLSLPFYHTAPALWNRRPPEFRQLATLSSTSPLAISPTLFHKKLKLICFILLFHLSLHLA